MVGASLAGLRAAEEIRHEGHTGPVIIVGDELHAPYDRPPALQAGPGRQLGRRTDPSPRSGQARHAWVSSSGSVVGPSSLDTEARIAALDDGQRAALRRADRGHRGPARPLPGTEGDARGARALRTLDDCLAIRADLAAAGAEARVVVIGAGFIGSEVAATCPGLGASVTVVEALPTPLGRVLGEQMGAACARLHRDQGSPCAPGSASTGCRPIPRARPPVVVHLADGTELPADVVVVGIGVVPAVEWLEGSGLILDNGVVCDELAVRRRPVVAAGDVARWARPVARASRSGSSTGPMPPRVGRPRPATCWPARPRAVAYDPVPFFWSDQYQTKIQVIGLPGPDDEVVVVDGLGRRGQVRGPLPAGGTGSGPCWPSAGPAS